MNYELDKTLKMRYSFKSWDDAFKFFSSEIWVLKDRRYENLDIKDAFEIWSEDEKIDVEEARETEESDDYDLATHNHR